MRFCPQCGAPLMAGAKFCVECGRPIASGGASSAGEPASAPAPGSAASRVDTLRRNMPLTTAFVFVFVAITVVGLLAAAWIMLRTPEAVREQVASVPITAAPDSGAPPSSNAASNTGGAAQPGVANPAAGGTQNGDLPAGHPRIELPTEARTFIDKIEKDAHAKPNDVIAWNKLGAVSMRAAMFDQTYYGRAEEAYGHVLKLEPDNLDALRGIGDIDYDKQHYDEAIAAYEHYLKRKPDDPEVRTDLGTMYLYTGNADQAIVQYKKAVAAKPAFFQAYYNMGIAYAQENKPAEAASTLKQAMTLAPDDTARKQVTDLIAKMNGAPIAVASASTQVTSPQSSPAAQASRAAAIAPIAQASRAAAIPPVAQASRAAAIPPVAQASKAAVIAPVAQASRNAVIPQVAKNTAARIASSPAAKITAAAVVSSPVAKSTEAVAAASVAASSPAAAPSTVASPEEVSAKTSESAAAAAPSAGAGAAADSMKDFHGEIEQMVKGLPIAGPKVGYVQWPEQLKGRVLMDNFPMDDMPPFAKAKFDTDLKTGIDTAKQANNISSPVELDIVDSATGRIMETVTH
jgi:tetratricopeptide (TPR) repeat protein